jgi:hypothetical protein
MVSPIPSGFDLSHVTHDFDTEMGDYFDFDCAANVMPHMQNQHMSLADSSAMLAPPTFVSLHG